LDTIPEVATCADKQLVDRRIIHIRAGVSQSTSTTARYERCTAKEPLHRRRQLWADDPPFLELLHDAQEIRQ
jgi:hypothetical protein